MRKAASTPKPRQKRSEPNPDFVPVHDTTSDPGPGVVERMTNSGEIGTGKDRNVPAQPKAKDPTITRVESFGFASFNLHVSDGTVLGGIAAGAGSNAANAAARDRIVALLGALVGGQP